MKVLVTGGAGFVGRYVVRELGASGCEVRVLDNFSSGKEEGMRTLSSLGLVQGDVADYATVKAAMEGVDHVVHLAALGNATDSLSKPQEVFRVNVQGFQNVLEAARETGMMGWLVFGSSAAVYGLKSGSPLTEEDSFGAVPGSPVAAANMINEVQAREYREDFGVRTIGLRMFNVYGEGQDGSKPHSPLMARVVHSVDTGDMLTIYGDGTQTRDFVHVQDVAFVVKRTLQFVPSADLPPVVNVGSGQAVSLLDAIRAVVQLKRVNPRVEYRPARGKDIHYSCADISRLRAVMGGWEPRRLVDGLRGWLVRSS